MSQKQTLTITKVDHDSWWGYYVDEELYGYNDYYNFSNEQVINEGIIRLFEKGLITHRDQVHLVYQQHYEIPGYSEQANEALIDNGDLPATLTELKEFFSSFKE